MKKIISLLALALVTVMTSQAQESIEQFTVATLNVDGLPQKLLVINVNADGPGDTGTARIGKYLVKKGYDLVMMQEDFSYHGVLSVCLEDDYKMDEWSGTLYLLDGLRKIDFLHLQNHRFECDGLLTAWKNDLQVTSAVRTPWTPIKLKSKLETSSLKGSNRSSSGFFILSQLSVPAYKSTFLSFIFSSIDSLNSLYETLSNNMWLSESNISCLVEFSIIKISNKGIILSNSIPAIFRIFLYE